MGFWQFYLQAFDTKASCVCKHFKKSVKLENNICSSNAQPGSLMRNHEKMVMNVFFFFFCKRTVLKAYEIVIKTDSSS